MRNRMRKYFARVSSNATVASSPGLSVDARERTKCLTVVRTLHLDIFGTAFLIRFEIDAGGGPECAEIKLQEFWFLRRGAHAGLVAVGNPASLVIAVSASAGP